MNSSAYTYRLKLETVEIVRSATGSLFYAAGPALGKSLLPNCVRTRGTSKVPDVDDRSRTRFSRQRCYECLSNVDSGCWHPCASWDSLYSMRRLIGSQCRGCIDAVPGSRNPSCVTWPSSVCCCLLSAREMVQIALQEVQQCMLLLIVNSWDGPDCTSRGPTVYVVVIASSWDDEWIGKKYCRWGRLVFGVLAKSVQFTHSTFKILHENYCSGEMTHSNWFCSYAHIVQTLRWCGCLTVAESSPNSYEKKCGASAFNHLLSITKQVWNSTPYVGRASTCEKMAPLP